MGIPSHTAIVLTKFMFICGASKSPQILSFYQHFIFIYSIIFWTDWGTLKIERSSYDGTERRAIVTSSVLWPNGLVMDRTSRYNFNGT